MSNNLTPDSNQENSANSASPGIDNEVKSALADLDDAADTANQLLAEIPTPNSLGSKPDAPAAPIQSDGTEQPVELSKAEIESNRKQRLAAYIARANYQKDAGMRELQRSYAAITLEFNLVLNDVNVASSAERFLGMIDKALYVAARSGANIMGKANAEKINAEFDNLIKVYVAEADESLRVSQVLTDGAKKESFDWIEPTYANNAFQCVLRLKSRSALSLVKSMVKFDEAIKLLCIAEWNDIATSDQVTELRKRERDLFKRIFFFGVKTVIGMQRKSRLPAPPVP